MNKMKKIAGLGVSLVMLSAVGLSDVYAAKTTTSSTVKVDVQATGTGANQAGWCDGTKSYVFFSFPVADKSDCTEQYMNTFTGNINVETVPNLPSAASACTTNINAFNKKIVTVPSGQTVCVIVRSARGLSLTPWYGASFTYKPTISPSSSITTGPLYAESNKDTGSDSNWSWTINSV